MSWRKVGMTSSHHGPYVQGDTRATMAAPEGGKTVRWSESLKAVVVGIGVCNSTP
jgi:nitrous oxide reductase accessory protein NosL